MMNYFELYDLPVAFQLDTALVKQRFLALSRKYHPDFFAQADAKEQAAMLEMSSLVNKAYKVFQQPDETMKYVLQLKGLLAEEEKYQLPPDFLMEMMELNEQLMDAQLEADTVVIEAMKQQINAVQAQIYAPVKTIIEGFDAVTTTEEALLQVKEYYFKKKYLSRILEGLR
jgi:molecular chaperone HscB